MNGTCATGCAAGFMTELCNISMLSNLSTSFSFVWHLKENLFLTWTYIYKNDYISLAGYSLKITMCSLEDCIHKWQSIGFKGCQDGQYGRDCRYNCSGNCLNDGVCDRQNGTCGSCAMGYQGRKCDKSMA